jgi:hypothetical protein
MAGTRDMGDMPPEQRETPMGMGEAGDVRDVEGLYTRMRPDQRTAVANEFIRVLSLAGDTTVQRFSQEDQVRQREMTDAAAPGSAEPKPPQMQPAEAVVDLHRYVRERHPDLFEQVMRHPVTVAAMRAPGAAPIPDDERETAGPPVLPEAWQTRQAEQVREEEDTGEVRNGPEEDAGCDRDTIKDAPDALMETDRFMDEHQHYRIE